MIRAMSTKWRWCVNSRTCVLPESSSRTLSPAAARSSSKWMNRSSAMKGSALAFREVLLYCADSKGEEELVCSAGAQTRPRNRLATWTNANQTWTVPMVVLDRQSGERTRRQRLEELARASEKRRLAFAPVPIDYPLEEQRGAPRPHVPRGNASKVGERIFAVRGSPSRSVASHRAPRTHRARRSVPARNRRGGAVGFVLGLDLGLLPGGLIEVDIRALRLEHLDFEAVAVFEGASQLSRPAPPRARDADPTDRWPA